MRHKKKRYAILSENEELELTSNGDFTIKKDLVENYEIFHLGRQRRMYETRV